jgi:autotransporter strand-loop-strand O-heptosyltransferase
MSEQAQATAIPGVLSLVGRVEPPAASASATPAAPSATPSGEAPKHHFPLPAAEPTQAGPRGLRYDFNHGARVLLPESTGPESTGSGSAGSDSAGSDSTGPWRVRLSDLDTGNILFETEIGAGRVSSTKLYYLRVRIEVRDRDGIVLQHDYDARDRDVIVQFPVGTLGDILGWFPYAVKFQRATGCRLSVAMADWLIPLFRDAYPEITFLTHEEVQPERYYATYNIGLYFDDDANIHQPCDFRLVGLHRTAGYILGVDPAEEPAKVVIPDDTRPIAEPYVCIAAQSTTQAKYWNNPSGWYEIVRFLKEAGYRVVCIDRSPVNGGGLVWNHIPNGVEDETGDRPLAERARWLKHAAFFVGLSSGLSWLAWSVGTPVVMISGFTHPTNEFATPFRVINYHVCNSCWNDVRLRFDHQDFLWCPRHKDTPRQFECTRLITVAQVKDTIRRIPGFAAAGAGVAG